MCHTPNRIVKAAVEKVKQDFDSLDPKGGPFGQQWAKGEESGQEMSLLGPTGTSSDSKPEPSAPGTPDNPQGEGKGDAPAYPTKLLGLMKGEASWIDRECKPIPSNKRKLDPDA